MTSLRTALLLGFVWLALGASTASAQPTQTPAEPPAQPTLDDLLDRFPVGTEPVGTNGGTIVGQQGNPDSRGTMWLLLAGGGALVLLLVSGATAFHWQRVRVSDTVGLESSTLTRFHRALAQIERSPGVVDLSKYHKSRQSPPEGAEMEAPPAQLREHDYDGFGKRVIGILEAAETAAAQIRAEAEEDAERARAEATNEAAQIRAEAADAAADIRKAAEDEGRVYIARAEQEAENVRGGAEEAAKQTQSAAEAHSLSRREEAEAEVREILAAAETQALSFREAAAEHARRLEVETQVREDLLRAQVEPLEENLRKALEAFRGMSGQLEELLAELPGASSESLVDTLHESAREAEVREHATH